MNDLPKALKYGLVTICTVGGAIGLYSLSAALISSLRPNVNMPTEEVSPEVTYPVRIQYQTIAGNVIKVGAQRIYYATESEVSKAMGPTQSQHLQNVQGLEAEIQKLSQQILETNENLAEARNEAEDTFDATVTKSVTPLKKEGSGKDRFRNMLANSGAYEQADNNASIVINQKINPLKSQISTLENTRNTKQNELAFIRTNLSKELFDALPYSARYITTDEDGRSEMTLPAVTHSYCWADFTKTLPGGQEERLRWLLLLPDELDANGIIVMSHDNIYTGLNLSSLTQNQEENLNINNR